MSGRAAGSAQPRGEAESSGRGRGEGRFDQSQASPEENGRTARVAICRFDARESQQNSSDCAREAENEATHQDSSSRGRQAQRARRGGSRRIRACFSVVRSCSVAESSEGDSSVVDEGQAARRRREGGTSWLGCVRRRRNGAVQSARRLARSARQSCPVQHK